jgi:hypothetical protein
LHGVGSLEEALKKLDFRKGDARKKGRAKGYTLLHIPPVKIFEEFSIKTKTQLFNLDSIFLNCTSFNRICATLWGGIDPTPGARGNAQVTVQTPYTAFN